MGFYRTPENAAQIGQWISRWGGNLGAFHARPQARPLLRLLRRYDLHPPPRLRIFRQLDIGQIV